MSEIGALLTSFDAIKNIAKSLLSLRDLEKLNATVIELQAVIIDAQASAIAIQQSYTALETKKSDLEAECMRLKDWSAEKQNYAIREVASGVFAYIHKNNMQPPTSAHKYCCNCFDQDQKSILHVSNVLSTEYLLCPRCNFKVVVDHFF